MYRVVSVLVSVNTQRIVSHDDVAFNKDGPEYMRYRSVDSDCVYVCTHMYVCFCDLCLLLENCKISLISIMSKVFN